MSAAGRPKSTDPAHTFTVRLSGTLRQRFETLAKAQRRRPSELLRLLIEDAVTAHEAAAGASPVPK